jgi:methylthioribose-1-phosphate isomerase
MVLQAIKYDGENRSLEILDQLRLPHEEVYIPIKNKEEAWHAIKDMKVRGAPAIAIVAALALAVELGNGKRTSAEELARDPEIVEAFRKKHIDEALDYLVTSRPTAVNLADAAGKLKAIMKQEGKNARAHTSHMRTAYIAATEKMLIDDVTDNEGIGRHGAEWLMKHSLNTPVNVITHCNTGSLATAGHGTALGVIRTLHAQNQLSHVFYTETRPYNQGSRLTGYELLHDNIPCTLITDSMAGALMRIRNHNSNATKPLPSSGAPSSEYGNRSADDAESGVKEPKDEGRITAIIVGADRVAANGDTANKIGTYALAVLARHHGVKFLVAAPRTTIDLQTPSGEHIVVEERPQREMLSVKGPRVTDYGEKGTEKGKEDEGVERQEVDVSDVREISLAAKGTRAWNPAFDVTPHELIDGIVTEVGVVEKVDGLFDLKGLF